MATWFSGTDTSTLQEEGSYKNNFVSLIVNNEGKYTAAITRHVYCEVKNNTTYTYEMFGDGTVAGEEEGTEKKECIEYFMMEIHKPDLPENTLDSRISEILENKRKSASKTVFTSNQTAVYNDRTSYDVFYGEDEPFYIDNQDVNKRYKSMDIPWTEKEFNTKPRSKREVNKDALRTTMAKILTGNIVCTPYAVDIDSWISNYDKVYSTKFSDLIDYSEWLAPYLEYLMYHIPGIPNDIVDDIQVAAYADEIIKRIGKPKGKFSAELIDQLRFYGTD